MNKLDSLTDIPKMKYTGYVWLSNENKPTVLIDEVYDFGITNTNPFIVEALLWNKDEQVSVMIRHSGTYHIHEYDLSKENQGIEWVQKEYLPHKLTHPKGKEIEKVKFTQLWLAEEGPLCEGMEVMTMKALVFTGFKFKTN